MVPSHACLAALLVSVVALSGCVGSDPEPVPEVPNVESRSPEGPHVALDGNMTFVSSVVGPAVHYGVGLYEPTIDVSGSGVIYISAHTAGVDTTGAPAFFSDDDGATWKQLPFAGPVVAPEPVHGGTPPPSDEIFIVAGDDGQAWGVDITLLTFPVNGWCDDGGRHCHHNPNAYERTDTLCSPVSLNDRPWAAYANGTLLMVNNPGGGPVQVGAMQVPPPAYVGLANPVTGPKWNMCASSGGSIPGIPDIRDDGFFAVPQRQGDAYVVVTGYADDVMAVEERKVFDYSHVEVSEIGQYGQAVFDADGTMLFGAMSNSADTAGPGSGGIQLAVSHDDGVTFETHRYDFPQPVSSIYLDGNKHGPGALINWGQVDGDRTDWYMGHIMVDEMGEPVIRNATLAVDDGPDASRHVQGAALGPDGRGYMVMSEVSGNDRMESLEQAGMTPMSVVVQADGPRLPVLDVATAENR
ncbi:MAG: hypothetical protein KY455_10245 [Euryarchaeota archaeon]|nr:hypothetical protein [Euryarchaeota archaeon]